MILSFPMIAHAGDGICACYYNEEEYCEYFFEDDAGATIDSGSECTTFCDDEFGDAIIRTDYAADSDSDGGITVGADCSESDEAAVAIAAAAGSSSSSTTSTSLELITPVLSVDIPTVTFTEAFQDQNNVLHISFLGDYISGLYVYLLGISTTIAIVFIMVAGLRYALSAGGGSVESAKTMIRNALTGLVLLLCAYAILFVVNPNLIGLRVVELTNVAEIALDQATSGDEGVGSSGSRATCDQIVETAKASGTCNIEQSVMSPTGNPPNCGNHHWFDGDANGDYKKIKNLDYAAGWGLSILAPFEGTVTYRTSTDTSNRCGNVITLTGTGKAAGAQIYICHAKDFLDDTGTYSASRTVSQGDVLGHLGGNCCAGEKPPSSWSAAENGWCDVSGTPCTDPTKSESCTCQTAAQAGNTSGPHVHITWNISGGDLLACLDY